MLVYALDIGGSSIKQGLIEVTLEDATLVNLLPQITLPSVNFSDLKELVVEAVNSVLDSLPNVRAIGISTTGSVDPSGTVVSAGHFKDYKNISWSQLLKSHFPQIEKVATVNDGRASAWAEYCANPAGVRSHIHVVVGTGVGGGIVHNGELLQGDSGQAGYIGHIKITTEPTPACSCGSQGCVEVLASAPAIVRYVKQHAQGDAEEGSRTFDSIISEAQSGNEMAVTAFTTAGHWLGLALGNAMNVLNPSVVTVGGGVLLASESIQTTGDGGPFLRGVSAGITKAAHRRISASSSLRPARFGNDGGMIGAARLATV
jgi:glucokinase